MCAIVEPRWTNCHKCIHITNHALERWRARAADYADAPKKDVKRALLESELVDKDDILPPTIIRAAGESYYYHRPTDCYFIVRHKGDEATIITVRCPAVENHNFIHAKPVVQAPEPEPDPEPVLLEVPAFDSPPQEREWLIQKSHDLEAQVREFPKDSWARDQTIAQIEEVHRRIRDNRPKCQVFKHSQENNALRSEMASLRRELSLKADYVRLVVGEKEALALKLGKKKQSVYLLLAGWVVSTVVALYRWL